MAQALPPSILDDFKLWLERSNFDTLGSDVVLMQYLMSIPKCEDSKLCLRQLGTRFAIDHESHAAKGYIILNNVSMRLQAALVDYALGKNPTSKAKLWDNVSIPHSYPPESLL